MLFFIVQAAPGDFLTQLSQNPRVTPKRLAQLRANYLLDLPQTASQYIRWLTKLHQRQHGDFSFAANQPVWDLVAAAAVRNSLILRDHGRSVLTYAVGLLMRAFTVRCGPTAWGDRFVSVLAYFGLGIPSFFFGLLASCSAWWR